MFELASKELAIDYSQSVMVGDKLSDLKPSIQLGMKSFLVKSVHESEQDLEWLRTHNVPILDHVGQVVERVAAASAGNIITVFK